MSEETHGTEGVHAVEVLRTDTSWNGVPYERYPEGVPQLTVMRFSIPAHSSLSWHEHVVPNAAFVIEGAMTVEDRATGATHTVRAGEAFGESVGAVHRGYTADQATEVVVTYAGVEGVPLSIQAPITDEQAIGDR